MLLFLVAFDGGVGGSDGGGCGSGVVVCGGSQIIFLFSFITKT